MKKRFIALINKKNKASTGIEALMVFCTSLIMFMVIMLIVLSAFSNINNKWKIKQCAREYLLLAESQGCLTSDDMTNMTNELTSYGLTSINTSGTTTQVQPYGDPVFVVFSGTYINNGYSATLFSFQNIPETLTVTRRSTSKY